MISYDEAINLILDAVPHPVASRLPIEKAPGHALCEDITSSIDISPFRNSAMDGFAVCSHWLKDCSPGNPTSFPIAATIYAGIPTQPSPLENQVTKVMTGAAVPERYDAVVPVEAVTADDMQVIFIEPVKPGTNIRPPGEDIKTGQVVFARDHVLEPLHIGVLAGIGMREVPVFRKPSILVLSTGDELVEPGETLTSGRIYDSNRYTLHAMLAGFCSKIETRSAIRDRAEDLNSILACDDEIIVSSGGVSMGDRDLLIASAEATGWESVFHIAAIKPGKPIYFARRGDQLLFGLPGNPLSAAVTARLHNSARRKSDRLLIWPGKIWQEGSATLAAFSPKKSSAALSAVLDTDGLIFQQRHSDSNTDSPEVEVVRWEQIFAPAGHRTSVK
jgi:molybdopterin molybdotransferase